MAMYASTTETTNSNRASRVLYGPCSDQLRDVLRHFVPVTKFQQVIRQKRRTLPHLTQPQRDLILPKIGQYIGNYSDMDISLLYLLLRNICTIPSHSKGWGNEPDPSDKSLSANIDRIRSLRNRVGHSSSPYLSCTDFNDIWSSIKATVVEIDTFLNNGNKYEKEVDFLRNETMDPEMEKEYDEKIRKQVMDDKETRELVAEHAKFIEDHQKKLKEVNKEQEDIKSQQKKDREEIEENKCKIAQAESQYWKDREENIAKITHVETENERQDREIREIRGILDEKLSMPEEKPDVTRLRQRLIEINDLETREIPLTPLQEGSDKLPIEQLFARVIIKEDSNERRKGKKSVQDEKVQERKEVKSPDDILTKNGKPVRRVFMLGDAAHGKTTYCMWLLKKWCNAQRPGSSGKALNEWENALSQFDFVFHIPLRHVKPSRANVTDMICQDILESDSVLQTTVKHVLSSDKYRCFIIMDGLDEWKPNRSAIDELRYKGIPNIENMSNCVIFTTMRPWMFAAIAGLVRDDDKLIEILGLDDKSIKDVIEKVLVHYYEMKQGTNEYEAKYIEIISNLKHDTLRSFIHIPLLAVICVQIWYEGDQVEKSLSSFYIAMVNMLIERAHLKHDIQNLLVQNIIPSLPKCLSSRKNVKNYMNVLTRLGKVAYEGLISKQMRIIFQKDDLESEVGERELQFALHVGLISQKEATSVISRNVCVHFFHKSFQEFLAAIYIVTQSNAIDSFCEHISNVEVIMELSNVILFICGVCPSLGSVISKHVLSVTDRNAKIIQYRESPWLGNAKATAEELYKLQKSWYREFKYGRTDSQVVFCLSDIFLSQNTEAEIVKETKEILYAHCNEIRSIYLRQIPTDEKFGIATSELNDFLASGTKTRSLVMLYIYGRGTDRSLQSICGQALKTLVLSDVKITDNNLSTNVRRPVLTDMPCIQRLRIGDIDFGYRDLGLTPDMVYLKKVDMTRVKMSSARWENFLQSVLDIYHPFDVELFNTDITNDFVKVVCSNPQLNVTKYCVYPDGGDGFEFTRVLQIRTDTNANKDTETDNDIDTETDNDIDTGTDNDIDTETDNDIDTETDNDIDTGTDNDIDTETDNDIDTETDNDIDTETDNDIDTGTDNDIDTETDNDIDTETDNDIDTGTDNDIDTGTDNDIDTETDNDIDTGTDNDIDTGTDNDIDTGTDNDIDTGTDNDIDSGTDNDLDLTH